MCREGQRVNQWMRSLLLIDDTQEQATVACSGEPRNYFTSTEYTARGTCPGKMDRAGIVW